MNPLQRLIAKSRSASNAKQSAISSPQVAQVSKAKIMARLNAKMHGNASVASSPKTVNANLVAEYKERYKKFLAELDKINAEEEAKFLANKEKESNVEQVTIEPPPQVDTIIKVEAVVPTDAESNVVQGISVCAEEVGTDTVVMKKKRSKRVRTAE